jgi:hypothetical protein
MLLSMGGRARSLRAEERALEVGQVKRLRGRSGRLLELVGSLIELRLRGGRGRRR